MLPPARKSKYQTDAWQPKVVTSSGDAKNQRIAAATYTAIYGGTPQVVDEEPEDDSETPDANSTKVPKLTQAYYTAPSLVAWDRKPNGPGKSGNTALTGGSFYVDLGALRTAEQECLAAANTSINAYERLRKTVRAAVASDDIFGQMVGIYYGNLSIGTTNGVTTEASVEYDPLDQEGRDFAESTNPRMEQLLQAVGGAIEVMGVFNATLNNAGQMYAQSDHDASFGTDD
ncbi:hypothetical protein [Streptomyces tsukubensis]|uniref:hypothetical protein n=1 Tax=Streptomyces tsukubensis TaxID=83656 RepID=UPI00117C78C5|nr:hypothetical protein [Streptomyces tsukubensis]QFR93699.1 hypothetical protein GBW32_12150 [Streptomyces tsukubensis]